MPIPGVEFGEAVVNTWGAYCCPRCREHGGRRRRRVGRESRLRVRRFGVEVVLIEMLDQMLPAEDNDFAKVVDRSLGSRT